ncbi:gluconate 2-dehydrogenase subunit 3 family protein [Croceibacterium aestuarii]|uniref:gluconate 2-dehydrogenase subunit 3 family protein n=1 Tax=Croceibacterium aestuarii TaxID=3064139 RepID=UPI00272E5A93|nr:gluconate 2-dehydrogenase subunit 3 family protein [Croceibacterium sp. D39]
MADPFPGYDVLDKRGSLSWNEPTRAAIDHRMRLEVPGGVLSERQLATLHLVAARVCPDPEGRAPTTTLAMVVEKIAQDASDGFRHHTLPRTAECWRRGLDAIEAEAQARYGANFASLDAAQADAVLREIESGNVRAREWDSLPPQTFWNWRLLHDLVSAHWAQPSLWSAMGFGGPASPRGYVRTSANRRDPWEAIERGEDTRGLPRHRE